MTAITSSSRSSRQLSPRHRAIGVGHLRAFEAVARHLNFRMAAEELSLTQSAVSRQIQALEEEVGTALFTRTTRAVVVTSAGAQLMRAAASSLEHIDAAVNHIRQNVGRRTVAITTWASFASMWLIPRLEAFQIDHPDIDIRIDATDNAVDLNTADVDVALRYAVPAGMPAGAQRLFGEQLTPVMSPWLLKNGPVEQVHDLARFALIEAGDAHRNRYMQWLTWQRWLDNNGMGAPARDKAAKAHAKTSSPTRPFKPQRWMYFNYAHQIVQAALSGQGVALARMPLVAEHLASGDLVEPLPQTRLDSPLAYWLLVAPRSAARPEIQAFCEWLLKQAAATREAIGDGPDPETLASAD
jgi:LysR family transcriptional regulator, glycine cleavage system transcriptional activator